MNKSSLNFANLDMATQEGVEQRRKTVFELALQGISTDRIGAQLGVTGRTIDEDLAAVRKRLKGKLDFAEAAKDLYAEALAKMGQRLRQLWTVIANSDAKPADKLNAVAQLREEDMALFKRAQIVGIIPRDYEVNIQNTQVNLYQTMADDFRRVYAEIRDKGVDGEEGR